MAAVLGRGTTLVTGRYAGAGGICAYAARGRVRLPTLDSPAMAKSSARRRQIARAKWERQEQRRIAHETAVRTRERISIGIVVVAVVGVVAGLGLRQLVGPNTVVSQPSPATTATPSTHATPTPTPTASK